MRSAQSLGRTERRMLVYFWFWYSRLVVQVHVTLADKAVEAIETAPLAGCTVRQAFVNRFGCMKLSVMPLSNNASTFNFPKHIVAVGLDRDPGHWVVAITGECKDADTLEVALL